MNVRRPADLHSSWSQKLALGTKQYTHDLHVASTGLLSANPACAAAQSPPPMSRHLFECGCCSLSVEK